MQRFIEIMMLVGTIAIIYGIYLIHVPSAFIAGGLLSIAWGWILMTAMYRGGGDKKY